MPADDAFPLDPDYTITEQLEEGVIRSRTLGGADYVRLATPPRRSFKLLFGSRPTTEKVTLLSWYREFEAAYFIFNHETYLYLAGAYVTRVFPVRFANPPTFDLVSNEAWDMQAELVEAVACALNDYPDPDTGHPTVTVAGAVVGADLVFVYGGYGFTSSGSTGYDVWLDGVFVAPGPVSKLDVPLGLHRVVILAGSGLGETIEVLI